MKGFVPTPAPIVDLMIDKLFRRRPPTPESTLLDPGCGEGEFIEGVLRWCARECVVLPRIVGIEACPERASIARKRFARVVQVQIRTSDFLTPIADRFDYIVGNPPYVSITSLSVTERETYRRTYATAKGRFDLYMLFYEQSLRLLKPDGRLVLITPEKFLYVDTALPLRDLLRRACVDELHFLDERTFGDLVTYPLVATIFAGPPARATRVIHRDGISASVRLDTHSSWLPLILGATHDATDLTLADVCIRISCGVATGADSAYVLRDADMPADLAKFARPTISGRQIAQGIPLRTRSSILVPYDETGRLLPESRLGALGRYLSVTARRAQLMERTCSGRKPWYAYHDNLPLPDMLRPKLLCKDITSAPFFVMDRTGQIVPRHSTYYVVPKNRNHLGALAEYLNSAESREWLTSHCQRAASGFLRLQSHVLKRLPVPAAFAPAERTARQLTLDAEALLV
jgi:hypothetical protein